MQTDTVESRFAIQPDVSGQFYWEGATLTFTPDVPLSPEVTYTVSLEAGAESTADRRAQTLSWSFRPRMPGVLYLAPADVAVRSLWYVPVDGSSPPQEIFPTDDGVFDFAPSPDGLQVAVTVFNTEGGSDIWLVEADGSTPRRLIACAAESCSTPAWSPDGRQLAYERQELAPDGGLGASRIWLYDLPSKSTAPVFEDNQILGYSPTWSADGRRLAFFDPLAAAIRALDVESGGSAFIPSAMGKVGVFSPDGEAMAFVDMRLVGRQFFTQLFVADFEGEQGIRPLVEDAQEDNWPGWSPDGRWVVFGRLRLDRQTGFGSQMMLLDWETGDLRQVTQDARYNNLDFRWGPTGRYILFTRFDLEATSARPELWLYDTTSPEGELIQLVENASVGRWLP